MSDLIDRQAAINALCKRCDLVSDDDDPCTEVCNDIKILKLLPSAQPEITQEDVELYCRRRCLTLITNELFDEMKARWSAQPKIIRCGECKHSFLHDNGEKISRICGLTRMCGTTPDDWYCADAERREE